MSHATSQSIAELEARLAEAEETLEAIRSGSVDALVVRGEDGEQVFTLSSADRAFRELSERMSDGAATLSDEGLVLWANHRLATLTGRPLGRLVGASLDGILPLDTDPELGRMLDAGRAIEQAADTEVRRPNGERIAVRLSVFPVKVGDAKARALVFTDLTERRESERILRDWAAELERRVDQRTQELLDSRKRLESTEERMRRLLEAVTAQMPVGVIVAGVDGLVIYRNAEIDRIWLAASGVPLPGGPLAARTFLAGITFRGSGEGLLDRALVGEWVADEEISLEIPDGTTLTLLLRAEPVLDNQGRTLAAVCTVMDVTNRRKAEAMRDAFIDVTAHQLKTPLTSMLVAAQTLATREQSGQMSPELRRELLADTVAETEQLIHLVNDLLVVSRVERGINFLVDEPIMLDHLAESVIAAEKRRGNCDPELRIVSRVPVARGEATYVEQVIGNLLSNASKYGKPPIEVVVRTDPEGVAVRVLDRGPGFTAPPESLFELYYRQAGANRQASGAGIGLFVCRELVRLMGGRVWAANRPDGGADFGFVLPFYDLEER